MSQNSQEYIPIPPDLNAWIRLMMQGFAASLNCVSLATVVTFYPATQTVDLSINYIRVFKNANADPSNLQGEVQPNNVYLPYPVIISCPVFILQGGGGYLTFPITKGDTGLVLFNDRELTTWMKTGQIVAPQNQRTHDLSDGIYFGGIRNLLKVIANYNTTVASLTDLSGERLNVTGDIKASYQVASHSGWLLMDGASTIGNASSGATYAGSQYQALFTLLGGSGFSGGSKVTLPQGEGYTLAGYKSGDSNFGTLGANIGESAHTLTIPEIPAHNHLLGEFISDGANSTSWPKLSSRDGNLQATTDTGGGLAHNNIQQTLVINWFIKI